MKFSFSLSLALSLCSVAQAGELTEAGDLVQADSPTEASKPAEATPHVKVTDILEDHNYEVQVLGDYFLISSPEYEDGWPYVDIIGFSPKRKVAVIETAKNDEEPEHEKKLSLTRIYNSLAKRGGVEPDEIRLMAFTVEKEDTKTNELIAEIRKGRNIGSWKGVKILPGDKEWDVILATQYFVKLLQVANKPAQKILLSTRKFIDRWDRAIVHTNYISFHFGQPDIKTPVPGTAPEAYVSDIQPESDDEEQEAALKALFAEEDKNGDALQVEIAHHLANQVLEAEERI